MSLRLADRLNAARRRQFVGRSDELVLFETALTSPELPFFVLQIFGPGGVGKTSLLKQFATIARHHDAAAYYLDARNIEPAPAPFLDALRLAMGLEAGDSPQGALASNPSRQVILIDTYETLETLDDWLREEFLPGLPERVLLVAAGRNAPAQAWRSDPGWQELVHILPLRNLEPSECRDFLTQRSVPAEQHQEVLNFTHGHPLALSLVADVFAQRPGTQFHPEAVPDIVKTLLGQFVQKVPGPAHRAALEACALVRVTTEALLGELLAMGDVHELFEWLRSLSFIESGQEGLFPHDLAREALVADLRWRNPDWHLELHRRARSYYATRLQQVQSGEQQRLMFDYAYLHRDNPIMRSMFQWQGAGSVLADAGRASDWPAIEEMVRRHEGQEAAELAAYWYARQPQGLLTLRGAGGAPVGMMMMLSLEQIPQGEIDHDPAVHAADRFLRKRAPLYPGERATLFRFWMAQETYQEVSPLQSLIFINVGRHYLTTPGLAYTFFPCADPDSWAPGFAYIDLTRIPEADFQTGGRRYGVYGHDWRTVPTWRWLSILAEREMGTELPAEQAPAREELVVLSESTFAEAVKGALKGFTSFDALDLNPLLQSRLIASRTENTSERGKRVEILRQMILEAAESLQSSPRESKYYRALYRTYLNPVATQERAAEILNLPFSTYRRHLASGIERVTRILWQQEIGTLDIVSRK
jgi:hypothetical protein